MNVNKIIAKTATSPSTITPLLEQPMPCIREKDRKAAECGGNSRDTDEQRGGRPRPFHYTHASDGCMLAQKSKKTRKTP